MNTPNLAKGMAALSLIGGLFSETGLHVDRIPFVLAGDLDEDLYHGFYLAKHGAQAEFRTGDAATLRLVENFKIHLRNRPHEQGTVGEISARMGISKSEVRRRRAAGTLDELFKSS
jgi:hypothetical protein